MAIFFALIALVGWGAGDIFVTLLSRKIGSRKALFLWLLGSFVLASLYVPFAKPISDYPMFIFIFILHLFGLTGTVLYFKALEIGNASLVGTIAGAFPIITVPLSVAIFAEKLGQIQILAIAMTICGLIFSTLHWQEIMKSNFSRLINEKSILYALVTFIIWGVFWTLIRIPVAKIGWFWSMYPGYLLFVLLPLFGFVKKISIGELKNRDNLKLIIPMCLLTLAANFGYNLGITYGYTSIVAPIAGSSPVLFVILSRFVFRDKLTSQQKAGIGLTLTGIVLIGISSI